MTTLAPTREARRPARRAFRLTSKVFWDMAIYMVGLGLVMGVIFPPFVVLLGVPDTIAGRPIFRLACLLAGFMVGAMNYALVKGVVGGRLTLLCGHYKDVDERVRERLVTDEISLGDFVLSGGEIAALAVIDAVVRLLPGVLGDFDSAQGDSYHDDWVLGPPSYTRPAEYRGMKVPEVLLSGDHAAVAGWRSEEAERLTRERRPDLIERRKREEERP